MNESGWADTIRQAVTSQAASLHEIERRSGVSTAVISRFMRGERTLTLPVAEKLCDALGLSLTASVGEKAGRGQRGKKG